MSSHLYYDRGSSVLADADYDALTELVASEWGSLSAFLQWQLGSPAEILATGSGVKLTRLSISAAHQWHVDATGNAPALPYSFPRKWRMSPKGLNPASRCPWTPIGG